MIEYVYRNYVANSLRILPEGNKQLQYTLDELLHPKPVDNRTVEEITEDICNRAGITIKRNK
jgi:hypothetical protein